MKDDRVKHKILPSSKFGLTQITSTSIMNIKMYRKNPNIIMNGFEDEAPIGLVPKVTHGFETLIKKRFIPFLKGSFNVYE